MAATIGLATLGGSAIVIAAPIFIVYRERAMRNRVTRQRRHEGLLKE